LRNSARRFSHQHHLWPFIFKAETLLAGKLPGVIGFALNSGNLSS
jgi:hypothetical protein